MPAKTYLISAALTLAGAAEAISGISSGDFKPVAIGLVLLLSGAVFALLYLGVRRNAMVLPEHSSEAERSSPS